jgi:hypothetical protein
MPSYPTPDSRNIYCGTGEVWFNRLDSSGNPLGYRHLGDVSKFDITPSATTIEHQSSMNAARAVDSQAITAVKMEIALTLSEFEKENVALALLGVASAYTQSSTTKTAAALGNAALGYAFDTGLQKIVVTDVKQASTTLVLGTDYTVDSDSGLITILASSVTVTPGAAITWDGSAPAITSTQVQGLANGQIIGALRFRSSTDAVGPRKLVDVWRVSIAPSGAMSLLGDAYGEIDLTGEALIDSTRAVGQQFCRVIDL